MMQCPLTLLNAGVGRARVELTEILIPENGVAAKVLSPATLEEVGMSRRFVDCSNENSESQECSRLHSDANVPSVASQSNVGIGFSNCHPVIMLEK